MSQNHAEWAKRNQHLQSLYVSRTLHGLLPDELFRERQLAPDLQQLLAREATSLAELNAILWRGAGAYFFNLKSARTLIEAALTAGRDEISVWLHEEQSARYMFDAFATSDAPYYGFGFHEQHPGRVLFADTLRLVLQRRPGPSFVLWTAYPLLAPDNPRWSERYDYERHAPEQPWPAEFYYFLNCYLTVAADFHAVGALVQGAADFFRQESRDALGAVRARLAVLDATAVSAADEEHLRYELTVRCLDENLPAHYLSRPAIFVEAMQVAFRSVSRLAEQV